MFRVTLQALPHASLLVVSQFLNTLFFTGIGLETWDVSAVESVAGMFDGAPEFNRDLSSWNVSSVQSMARCFAGSGFRGSGEASVAKWDVSSVENFALMFASTSFEGDLAGWNTASAINMDEMVSGMQLRTQALHQGSHSLRPFSSFWMSVNSRELVWLTGMYRESKASTACSLALLLSKKSSVAGIRRALFTQVAWYVGSVVVASA